MSSIVQWNCRGYFSNYEDLISIIASYNPAVVLLQETMLGNYNPKPTSGYTVYPFTPSGRPVPGDGLAFIINNSIPHRICPVNTNLQTQTFQVRMNQLYTICNIYLSNHDDITAAQLNNLINQLPEPYIICGDFNAKHPSWGNVISNRRGQVLEHFILENRIVLLNDGSHTHFHTQTGTSSAIDLTLASPDIAATMDWNVEEDLHGSDHHPIIIRENTPTAVYREPKYDEKRTDWNGFYAGTYAGDIWEDHLEDSIDDLVELYNELIISSADLHITKSSVFQPLKKVPWWDIHCSTANYERKRALRRYQRTNNMEDKIALKRATAKAKFTKRQARKTSWKNYIDSLNINTPMSKIWSRIRKMRGIYRTNAPPIIMNNNALVSEPQAVAEILADHFESVSSSNNYTEQFQRRQIREERQPLNFNTNADLPYNAPLTLYELLRSLNNCKNSSP